MVAVHTEFLEMSWDGQKDFQIIHKVLSRGSRVANLFVYEGK
jgi:hypothetical protein